MESFAELLEESLAQTKLRPGSIITGRVIDLSDEFVTIFSGLKSESVVPIGQFLDENGDVEVVVGDDVEVALDQVEDGFGITRLSREKAKRVQAWKELEKAHEDGVNVRGVLTGKIKGGFAVDVNKVRAFLPGSLVDVRPVRDTAYLEGKPLEFKVIKIDKIRNNIVVSRRAVVEEENSVEREALLKTLEEGVVVKGIVKNLIDYGAFVDLGGVDGLLHITDMAWKRVKHPSEIVNVGDELDLKVLKFDREKNRVSLGIKQLGEDPWTNILDRYPVSSRIRGHVSNIADYGCFVELEEGVEGLVHVSEMDWTNKNVHPNKVVQLGDEVEVVVLDIDEERRRISLGIKQTTPNPWEAFSAMYSKGDKLNGKIKSITDFGIFVDLDNSIDGLVHLSDISWALSGEEAIKSYKKGDDVETVLLGVDVERERISLGIKQIDNDPLSLYLSNHSKGSIVKGTVSSVDAKGAQVALAEGIDGYLRASEMARDKVEDARSLYKEGDDIEAMFTGIDRKKRVITLSIKAKESEEEAAAIEHYTSNQSTGGATLGDVLKDKMENQ